MLQSKNILVTGCSRGLGLEIIKELLLNGANVYGVSRTLTPEFNSLLKQYSGRVFFKKFDLYATNEVEVKIFKEWLNNKIAIHGFVNNAAVAYDDIITNMNVDLLESMFKVNVFSPLLAVKSVLRNMIFNRTKGSIVHVSSISVHTGYKGLSMYAGSKGALEAFSKNTAREWGEKQIRSNCLVAGFMETEMSGTLSDEQRNRIFKRTSLKVPTTLNSVAKTICFLLSDGAESITGQNIHVDSGTI
ncbi:SDR family oxidoreductase [Flavobacterium galactosidilyticum]|uniref:SDR family NAD(P)-dependent oxidoreductase n=1 Tax=Flavobacterium galactosidilyticum TaxID=2893886 RepID=UPI001E5B7EEB|nr:SDR family oxidoreductase [Flavobacterium sp. F-340]UFH46664.1 SDR family oxidoreductase [Flavobacterium sp. F-340]